MRGHSLRMTRHKVPLHSADQSLMSKRKKRLRQKRLIERMSKKRRVHEELLPYLLSQSSFRNTTFEDYSHDGKHSIFLLLGLDISTC